MATVPSNIRHQRILEELNEKYPNYVGNEELLEKLGKEMTEQLLDRDVTYLEEKGYVEVERTFGLYMVKITSRGIDFLEGKPQ